MLSAAKQVCFDVFVHLPFMYFPTFYAVKEFVQGTSWSPVDWVRDGCTKYYHNFSKDFRAMFQLWAPADVVLFSLPMWLRMPGRHVVSFGWTAYLSFLRGGAQNKVPRPPPPAPRPPVFSCRWRGSLVEGRFLESPLKETPRLQQVEDKKE